MSPSYDQLCPVALTLDIVGERWTFLILRDLLLHGPRRFHDFEESLRGIGPNTLSARLKTLEEAGVVERRLYEDHPPRAEYSLTEKGRQLGPVVKALRDWGERHTRPSTRLRVQRPQSPDATGSSPRRRSEPR
jgi:DNA-binding HxlR family transcriptional regulator